MQPIGFKSHDHGTCIAHSVTSVQKQCAERGLQLTPVRQRVLEILLAKHQALGAYDILAVLNADGFSAQPPVAYRALDFLVGNGFAHKIERLNAFVACSHPSSEHVPAFLICRVCENVAEGIANLSEDTVAASARDAGFIIERAVVEAEGVCPNCDGAQP